MKKVALLSMVLLGFSAGIVHAEAKDATAKVLPLDFTLNQSQADALHPTFELVTAKNTAYDKPGPLDKINISKDTIGNAGALDGLYMVHYYTEREKDLQRREEIITEKEHRFTEKEQILDKREHLVREREREVDRRELELDPDRQRLIEIEQYKREYCKRDKFCQNTPPDTFRDNLLDMSDNLLDVDDLNKIILNIKESL